MKTTGDIPKGRRGHSAAVVGNRMLVLGGHDEDNYFNDLYCLNFENAEWKQVSLKATVPRMAYHQCVTLGTSVLIYGGKRKNGSTTKVITIAAIIKYVACLLMNALRMFGKSSLASDTTKDLTKTRSTARLTL